MADQEVGLRIKTDGTEAVKTVGNIKKELRQAQQEAVSLSQRFGETSKEALDAAKRVAQLRDTVSDTNERIALFDPGAKFAAFGNVIRTVAGGFSALTGAVALFGVESKEVEKTLLKVQSALAITEGLNTIADAGKDFQRLAAFIGQTAVAQKVLAASTLLTSNAFKAMGVSVAASSVAFKALRAAIITTGIGALVIGITLLIQKLSSLTSETETAADAQEKLAESTRKANDAFSDQVDFVNRDIQLKIKRAKAAGASESEITKLEREAIEARLKLATEETTNRIKLGQDVKEQQAIATKALQELQDFDLDQEIKRTEKRKANAEKAAAESNTLADKQREEAKKRREQEIEDELKAQELRNQLGLEVANGGASEAALNARREAREKQLKIDSDAEDQRVAIVGNALATIGGIQAQAAKRTEEYAKADLELSKITWSEKAAIVSNALGTLSDAVGRQTAAGKALGIAQATIDGFLAVQKALASAPPPFNFIAAGAVGIATLANIRRIAATQIPGQSSSGSVPAGASLTPPSIPRQNITGQTSLDQNSLNQIGNATARAYVLESDVTGNQQRITRLNRAARLN